MDEWEKKSIKKLNELEEDLESFTGVGDETDVKEIMHQIEEAMNNAETSEGKERFVDFEGASQMKELAKLQDYNADKREEREKEVSSLVEKLKDGESLTYTEREILYQHIQKEELDEKDKEHVEKVNSYIKGDNEKLKEHLNDEVLASEKSLEEEIILFEKYLYEGNKGPSYLYGGSDKNRTALRSYLDILKNHHTTINEVKESMNWDISKEDPLLARVEEVTFSDSEGGSENHPSYPHGIGHYH